MPLVGHPVGEHDHPAARSRPSVTIGLELPYSLEPARAEVRPVLRAECLDGDDGLLLALLVHFRCRKSRRRLAVERDDRQPILRPESLDDTSARLLRRSEPGSAFKDAHGAAGVDHEGDIQRSGLAVTIRRSRWRLHFDNEMAKGTASKVHELAIQSETEQKSAGRRLHGPSLLSASTGKPGRHLLRHCTLLDVAEGGGIDPGAQ